MIKNLYQQLFIIFGCLLFGNICAMSRFDVKRIPTGTGVFSVQFDRSGKRILTGCDKLWDAATGECIYQFKEGPAQFDKRREVIFVFLKNCMQVYNLRKGVPLSFQYATNANQAEIDTQHAHIATAGNDCTARIWDTNSATCLRSFAEHTAAITSLSFFKKSPLLLTTSDDTTCKIWDLRQAGCAKTLQLEAPVESGELNKAENIIVCSLTIEVPHVQWQRAEQTMKVACEDWSNGTCVSIDRKPCGGEIAFNRSSNRVSVASGRKKTWLIDLSAMTKPPFILKHGDKILHIAMNKTLVATAGIDDTVKVWDAQHTPHEWSRVFCSRTLECKKLISTVACDKGGACILAGLEDGTIKIWNINSCKKPQSIVCSTEGGIADDLDPVLKHVSIAKFSKDGHQFATGCSDGTLAIGTMI